ncbi:hypothetical protein C6341_g24981 [Phytophthora cactorum]|nr:hypothetical protein C6341_g24981 [Phytophthora cactorum]
MCAIFLLWSANCVPEEEVDVWQHLTGEERDVKASTTETRSLCENYRILVDREKAFGLQDVANEEADMENLEEEANDDDITKPGNANATAVMGDKDATTGEKGMDGGG